MKSEDGKISPGAARLGWIGCGTMGSSMCDHLLKAGYEVTVHSRTPKRAEPLLSAGAVWADTAASVVARSEVVFTMVGVPADVRQVVLGPKGVLSAARPGTVLVDMTTSEPSLAQEIYGVARARGVASIDAPVSGGEAGARTASLSIMAGGDPEVVERVRPLLDLLGTSIVHQGAPGAGQHTKMANQILIATTMIGVCEALLYAHRAGLDLEDVLRSVSGGAAGSWSLSAYAPRILQNNFEPGFLVEHFIKDMEIALAEARRLNLALPGLALAHQLYVALRAQRGGGSGTQSLILALAELSAIDWQRR